MMTLHAPTKAFQIASKFATKVARFGGGPVDRPHALPGSEVLPQDILAWLARRSSGPRTALPVKALPIVATRSPMYPTGFPMYARILNTPTVEPPKL